MKPIWIYWHFHRPSRCLRMIIHHERCSFCNDGGGMGGSAPKVDPDPRKLQVFPTRAWIGPFDSIGAAMTWAAAHPYSRRVLPQRCGHCSAA